MDEYKIEYQQNTEIPMSLDTTYIRPPGLFSKIIPKKDKPVNGVQVYDKNASVKFEINTTYFLNPFTLFLTLDLVNDGTTCLKLDGSAHSLIKKIEVKYKNTGKVLEVIDDYDILTSLFFDLHLNKKDRRDRRANEGFGDNEYGSNEVEIPPQLRPQITFEERLQNELNWGNPGSSRPTPNIEAKNPLYINSGTTNMENHFFQDHVPRNMDFEVKIPRIEDWTEVKDGYTRPEERDSGKIEEDRHRRTFRIPLQLRTIGQAIQPDNFKYIPMAVIGPIVITITFCPEGVFIPVHVKKLDFYFGTGAQLRGDYDQGAERKFHYENVQLEYELSQFSPKATEELFNHVKNGEFILDNCSLEFINHFYVLPYPSIDGSSEFKEKREGTDRAFR